MPEPDDRLDDRLRAALHDLGATAERAIRSPGAAAVPAAARRHRRSALAAATALALILAGSLTAGWWFTRDGAPPDRDRVAAPPCAPINGSVFLESPAPTDDQRAQVVAALRQTPEVTSFRHVTQEEAWEQFKQQFADAPDLVAATSRYSLPESWRFTLRCSADIPALKGRLATVPGATVVLSADPGYTTASPSGSPPSSTPAR
ncbi:permease-like cell division protein FtsX [Dactylosporangium sp. CA-092794]|uniref:permease-like cell division protein FtsX n=1 Tax=Dactylosporangium sp. CA-092794 TaxID=3239929 RepID=UPI003D90C294